MLKTTTSTVEEDVYVAAVEAREPWSLPASIFKARAKEADARAFFDSAAVRGLGGGGLPATALPGGMPGVFLLTVDS